MNLGVSADVETLVSGPDASKAPATRTTVDADADFELSITSNTTQATVWEGTYGDIKAMDAPM